MDANIHFPRPKRRILHRDSKTRLRSPRISPLERFDTNGVSPNPFQSGLLNFFLSLFFSFLPLASSQASRTISRSGDHGEAPDVRSANPCHRGAASVLNDEDGGADAIVAPNPPPPPRAISLAHCRLSAAAHRPMALSLLSAAVGGCPSAWQSNPKH